MTTIRKALAAEADLLTRLALNSKASWGYSQQEMDSFTKELTLTPQKLSDFPTFVIQSDHEIAGFYCLEPVNKQEVELDMIFVLPKFIGQGLGTILMDHAMKEAIKMGFSCMVIQSDPYAKDFYIGMGAMPAGKRESGSVKGRYLPLLKIDLHKDA